MNNEFYKSNEYNSFGEYKSFPAEQYAGGAEISIKPKETSDKGHEYVYEKPIEKKKGSTGIFKRLLEKMTSTTRSIATAVVGVGAAAVVSAAIIFNVSAPLPECEVNHLYAGGDYVRYDVEISSLSENVDYSLVVENPYHSFEIDADREGEHKGLLTGLRPGLEYTLSFVGESDGNRQIYYEKEFYTANSDTPEAIFQVELEKSAEDSLNAEYQVYLSDAYKRVKDPSLELTYEDDVLYRDANVDNGFFNGIIPSLPRGKSALVLVGSIDGVRTVIGKYEINGLEKLPPPEPPQPEKIIPFLISPAKVKDINIVRTDIEIDRANLARLGADEVALRIYVDGIMVDEYIYGTNELGSKEALEADVSSENSIVRFTAVAYKTTENVDPVAVFEDEETIAISTSVSAEPYVNLYGEQSVNLSLTGVLPNDAVLVVVDKTNGLETEYPMYDDVYRVMENEFSWEFGSGKVTYSYYIKDGNGTVVLEGDEFEVDFTIEKSAVQMIYVNPMDVLITYNEDKTVNAYIAAKFTSDDLDVYCEVTLDEYGAYRFRDYNFEITNLPNAAYGIIYMVCKDINGVRYVMERQSPSGVVNEFSGPGVDVEFTEEGVSVYFSESGRYDFDGMRVVTSSGEEFTLDANDLLHDSESYRYILNLTPDSPCEWITVYVDAAAYINNYIIEDLADVEKKGSPYYNWEIELKGE